MTLKRKAMTGVIWSAIKGWGRQSISFAVFACLARLLSPDSFGLIALANTFLVLIQTIAQQGFSTAIIQIKDIDEEYLDTAFWSSMFVSVLLVAAGFAQAKPAAIFYSEPILTPVITCLSLSLIFSSLGSVQEAIFKREFLFKSLAIRSLVSVFIAGVVGISMAFLKFGVWSLVGYQLSNSLMQTLILWHTSSWRPKPRFSLDIFKNMFIFESNMMGIRVVDFFNNYADKFLIGYFLGTTILGYYEIAYRVISTMIQLLVNIINQVAMSLFSKLQEDEVQLKKSLYTSIQMTTLISFPAFLLASLLSPELVLLFFGNQWVPSIPVMRILAFVGIVYSISFFIGTALVALGKPDWRLKILLFGAIVKLGAFAVSLRWGITAIAASFTLVNALVLPINFMFLKRLISLSYKDFVNQFASSLLSSMVMGLTILLMKHLLPNLKDYTVMSIIIFSSTGCVVYFLSVRLVSPKTFKKLTELTKIIRSEKKQAKL